MGLDKIRRLIRERRGLEEHRLSKKARIREADLEIHKTLARQGASRRAPV